MINDIELGFEVKIDYDEEENGYQVEYIYDGEWCGTIDEELNPLSKEKATKLAGKILEILQKELNK